MSKGCPTITAHRPPTPPAIRFFRAEVFPFTSSASFCLSDVEDDVDEEVEVDGAEGVDGAPPAMTAGSGEAGDPFVVAAVAGRCICMSAIE